MIGAAMIGVGVVLVPIAVSFVLSTECFLCSGLLEELTPLERRMLTIAWIGIYTGLVLIIVGSVLVLWRVSLIVEGPGISPSRLAGPILILGGIVAWPAIGHATIWGLAMVAAGAAWLVWRAATKRSRA